MNQEVIQQLKKEALFQYKCYSQLKNWLKYILIINMLLFALLQFTHSLTPIVHWIVSIFFFISIMALIVVSYGLYKGKINLNKVLDTIDKV